MERIKHKTLGDCVVLANKGAIYLVAMLDAKLGYPRYAVIKRYTRGVVPCWLIGGDFYHTLDVAMLRFKDRISEESERVCE